MTIGDDDVQVRAHGCKVARLAKVKQVLYANNFLSHTTYLKKTMWNLHGLIFGLACRNSDVCGVTLSLHPHQAS